MKTFFTRNCDKNEIYSVYKNHLNFYFVMLSITTLQKYQQIIEIPGAT